MHLLPQQTLSLEVRTTGLAYLRFCHCYTCSKNAKSREPQKPTVKKLSLEPKASLHYYVKSILYQCDYESLPGSTDNSMLIIISQGILKAIRKTVVQLQTFLHMFFLRSQGKLTMNYGSARQCMVICRHTARPETHCSSI